MILDHQQVNYIGALNLLATVQGIDRAGFQPGKGRTPGQGRLGPQDGAPASSVRRKRRRGGEGGGPPAEQGKHISHAMHSDGIQREVGRGSRSGGWSPIIGGAICKNEEHL